MNNGFNSVSGRGPAYVADKFEFREAQYDDRKCTHEGN